MRCLLDPWFARPLVPLVVVAVLAAQMHPAWADAISQGAAKGRETGSQVTPNINDLFSTDGNGGITFFPNSGKPMPMGAGELYPGSAGKNADALKGLYGDETGMSNAGAAAHTQLGTETSMPGEAYRTILGSSRASRPNLTNDPIWTAADKTWNDLGTLAKDFADCSQQTTFQPGSFKAHVPDYKTCERIVDETRSCSLTHTYKPGIVDHVAGPLNLSSCGEGCLNIWIGTVGDNYWKGWCSIFEESIKVNVFNPDAVISATLDYAKWDDYMQVVLNGTRVWSGPNGNFPPETAGDCELGTSWELNPNADLTSYFKTAGDLEFKTRTSVAGNGEGYARLKIIYDPAKVLAIDEYSPPDCERAVTGMADGFCKGTPQCLDMPPVDADGCAVVEGIKLCEKDLQRIHPGLSPLCRRATINATCDFYKGQMECWKDPNGNQHCPTTNGENMASCAQFEANPSCGYIKSDCVGGAAGGSGTCYVREEVWDCGYDSNVPTLTRSTQTSCPGPIRCMGTDCVNPTAEQSGDFARAAAALQAARFMAMDANCNEDTTEANRNCEVFKGDAKQCKKAMGGIVDCCSGPTTTSLGDYISLILAVGKLDSAVSALDKSNALRGAWQTLSEPVNSLWTEVNKPFVQAWEGIWGGTEQVASDAVAKGLLSTVQQTLMKEVAKWTAQAFGDAAANSLFTVVTAAGDTSAAFVGGEMVAGEMVLGGPGAAIGTALGWIMWAYMVYQIVMILIQIIWACEKEEFELVAQKQLKNCHYVGSYCATKAVGACIEKRESYCCFNSPLSRIIQEQVRPQLGMAWGDPKDPQCGGLMADQLAQVDWSKVNLDEWLGILAETGHLPSESSMNLTNLTGTGSMLNVGGRDDAAARATARVGNINVPSVRQGATEELKGKVIPK